MAKYNHLPARQRAGYKQKWLVFDYDGRDDYLKAIDTACKNGFGVAFSSMCIEYWFLLHFEDHNGNPIPLKGNSHSQALIDRINGHIGKYNKKAVFKVKPYDSSSKQVNEDFFEIMMAIDPVTGKRRISNAFERANKIHSEKRENGCAYRESDTTIFELLIELGTFYQTGDLWMLREGQ